MKRKDSDKNEEKSNRVFAQVVSPWEEQSGVEYPSTYVSKMPIFNHIKSKKIKKLLQKWQLWLYEEIN